MEEQKINGLFFDRNYKSVKLFYSISSRAFDEGVDHANYNKCYRKKRDVNFSLYLLVEVDKEEDKMKAQLGKAFFLQTFQDLLVVNFCRIINARVSLWNFEYSKTQ